MRNYTYVWADPASHLIVASGIETVDVLDLLGNQDSVLLLSRQPVDSQSDPNTRLDYLSVEAMTALPRDEIYSWGDNSWADFRGPKPPKMSDQEVAELLYFAHAAKPLRTVSIPSLQNRFLFFTHDDGWRTLVYYSDPADALRLLHQVPSRHGTPGDHLCLCREILEGERGFWFTRANLTRLERIHDIDGLLNSGKYPTE